jgi:hypothetical protein
MHKIEVGQLYLPHRTEYPEGCEYNFYDTGHELRLILANPDRSEVDAVRKGRLQVGLLVEGPAIFLLYKLGKMLWSDAPYSWWMVPEPRRGTPEPINPGQGVLLQIVLIDASTGIVQGLRAVALDTEFSQALHAAITNQMQHPTSPQVYSTAVDHAYAKYSTTIDMVKVAQIGGPL